MAICGVCEREMLDATGCDLTEYEFADGEVLARIRYGDEPEEGLADPCHDCGAAKGTYHHPRCDMEDCPRCGSQLISCDCAK